MSNYPYGVTDKDFDDDFVLVCRKCFMRVNEDELNDDNLTECCNARSIEISRKDYNENH